MRESDAILVADLREAGLVHLAMRAAQGEWNDYFGKEAMPQHDLIFALRAETTLANVVRKRLIENVIAGKYDGTKAESEEWARSQEGREVFSEFGLTPDEFDRLPKHDE